MHHQLEEKLKCSSNTIYAINHSVLGYLPYSFDQTTLSGKLKAYRHLNGISQKKLGRMLNVDGATIISWEQGEIRPFQRTLDKIKTLSIKVSDVAFSINQLDQITKLPK